MEVEKNEEKIKVGLAMSAKASTYTPLLGSHELGAEIMKELKEINKM